MARGRRTGATAAAVLPAALAGAALVAAPFAGTTTSPLAKSTTKAQVTHFRAHAARTATAGVRRGHADGDSGIGPGVPAGSPAALAGSELLLTAVGAGVIAVVRRRHRAGDAAA